MSSKIEQNFDNADKTVENFSNELLKKLEGENPGRAFGLIGLSEASIASTIFKGFELDRLISLSPSGNFELRIKSNYSNVVLDSRLSKVKIDSDKKEVQIVSSIRVYAARTDVFGSLLAYKDFIIELIAKPSIVFGATLAIQLSLSNLNIIEEAQTIIVDQDAEGTDIEYYESLFREVIDAIPDDRGINKGLFKAIVESSYNHRFFKFNNRFEVLPRGINFENVKILDDIDTEIPEDIEVGYLFVIFDIRNLGFEPECFCEEIRTTEDTLAVDDDNLFIKPTGLLGPEDALKFEPPPYAKNLEKAQTAVIVFSQNAIREITKSFVNQGFKDSNRKTKRGFFAEVGYWATLRMSPDTTRILPDGIQVGANIAAEGRASAGVKMTAGNIGSSLTLEADTGLRIQARDINVKVEPKLESYGTGERYDFSFTFVVSIPTDIRVDFDGPLREPLDQVDDFLVESVLNGITRIFSSISISRTVTIQKSPKRHGYAFESPRATFFEGQSVVISAWAYFYTG